MRHLWSLIAGIVVAPLAWGLLAMGQAGATATVAAWAQSNAFDTTDLIKPAVYLAAAGILLGLIATLRISPLGSMIAGLAYLAVNVGLFIDPFATRDAIPNDWKLSSQAIPLHAPMLNGTLLAVGVMLLVAVVSTGRWRTALVAAGVAGAGVAAGEALDRNGEPQPGLAAPEYQPEGSYASAAPSYATTAYPGTSASVAEPAPAVEPVAMGEPASAPPGEGGWPPPASSGFGSHDEATSGFGSRPNATAPLPRHAAHDQTGAAADPWNGDDMRTRDRAERVADHDERTRETEAPEPGESPWAAPPRSNDRPE